jgi:deoxyadenosine/deoxycytidine kinase
MAYTSRLAAFQRIVAENPDCEWIICERSLEADRHIFAQMLSDSQMIDEVMFQVYMMLYNNTANAFTIDVAVYLDAEPEVCLERIGKRSREGESKISVEYLANCKKYYDKWMSEMETDKKEVIRLDANQDVDYRSPTVSGLASEWIETIANKIMCRPPCQVTECFV